MGDIPYPSRVLYEKTILKKDSGLCIFGTLGNNKRLVTHGKLSANTIEKITLIRVEAGSRHDDGLGLWLHQPHLH